MIKGAVGRRYARAIFDLASEEAGLDPWMSDLKEMQVFLAEPSVAVVLQNPEISFEHKEKVINAGLSGMDSERINLLKLLVRKRRTDRIDEIVSEFERLANERQGIIFADVTTAIPMDDATTALVANRLSALVGKKVIVRPAVDADIIGGVVARVGDKLIDGSVVGRLAALRDHLSRG
ncbi:MAG: ATP synthase F1 subunit delta [Chloroflexi bacterium]|nr:ATP synthase F1 subunit delta [Chloroflexota bacterium]